MYQAFIQIISVLTILTFEPLYADCKNAQHAKEHKQAGLDTKTYKCTVQNNKMYDRMFENEICIWCGCSRQDHNVTQKKLN